jgi:uncharacterized protein YcbX
MSSASLKHVGEVVGLRIHPVKSMRCIDVDEAHLGWQGLDGDRRYAFTHTGSLNGLPWVSARQLPSLVTYQPKFDRAEDHGSRITVTCPDGRALGLRDGALADEITRALGTPVHLMRLHRGAYDAMPVSLMTTRSVRTIADELGEELDVARFRANIVIETAVSRPYPEEKWVGDALVFGQDGDRARIQVNRRDERCAVVNVNPETGEPDLPVHRTVVGMRRNFLGVYGSTQRPGTIDVGAPVYLAT